MVEIAEGAALDGEAREIGGHLLGPGHRAVQQNDAAGPFGLKVLEQQSGHPTGADHRDLFLIQRNQIIDAAGLTDLELGQLNGRRTNRDRTGTQVGLGANPLTGADGLVEQTIEDRADRAMLLAQAIHLFDLGEDLALPQNKRVQARGHTHQVTDRFFVVVSEQVGHELRELQAGMLGEETANR